MLFSMLSSYKLSSVCTFSRSSLSLKKLCSLMVLIVYLKTACKLTIIFLAAKFFAYFSSSSPLHKYLNPADTTLVTDSTRNIFIFFLSSP